MKPFLAKITYGSREQYEHEFYNLSLQNILYDFLEEGINRFSVIFREVNIICFIS